MPNSYTQVFGGNTIYPSDVSYLALTLTANITLEWPLEASTGNNVVARILDVTSNGAYSISMPDATQAGVGQTVLFNNVAATTFTVKSYTGTTLISIPSGTQWELYLTDNTTATGTWRAFQFGAATTSAQAAALAGYGLVAQGATLAQSEPVTVFNTSYTFGAPDRAGAYVWSGGLGTATLPAASTAGNNWFVSLRNNGTGNLTLTAAGSDLINDAATLVLRPADSATVVTDGISFWTVGLGQDPVFAFDYTSISMTSQTSPYTLSGAELNRIAYQFVGILTANMIVYVPATTQQYWVANDTTGGSFTLSIGTSTQAAPLTVTRGSRGIYYCDGTSVIKADTASLAIPIALSDGGTGATTASGARVNLGGTSVGIAVFTAATSAAALTGIGGASSGANTFTATQTFSGSSSVVAAILNNAAETATVSATAATGTLNYDVSTQSVLYYTTNASANWTLNIRHSSGTTLNSALAIGQSATVTFLVTQGATAYYNSVVQIDGVTVTPKWQGGAPTSGNASGIDVYTYAVLKTGVSTFTVLASVASFT